MGEWLSTDEVADLLEVSPRTVQRSLETDEDADRNWGKDGWREKPLSLRRIVQVRRTVAERIAKGGPWRPVGGGEDEAAPGPDGEQDPGQ